MKNRALAIVQGIKSKLLSIWALLPILSLTKYDGYFGEENDYCVSLINFLLGENNLQIISVSVKKKRNENNHNEICAERSIRWCNISKLSELNRFNLSESDRKRLLNNYREHVIGIGPRDRDIEKEELLRKLSTEQGRIDTSFNKVNAFMAIFLAVIPLITGVMNWEAVLEQKKWQWLILLLLIYAILNLSSFLFQAFRVRGILLGSFADIKSSKNKCLEQMIWLYHDWQQTKRKADLFVSFVSYTQKWVIRVITMFTIYMFAISFWPNT